MRRVIVTIALGALAGGGAALAQGGGARTVKDGVYAAQQAARGKELYTKNCASCHQQDLSGADPFKGFLQLTVGNTVRQDALKGCFV